MLAEGDPGSVSRAINTNKISHNYLLQVADYGMMAGNVFRVQKFITCSHVRWRDAVSIDAGT